MTALKRGDIVRRASEPKRTGHVDHVLPSGSVRVDWNRMRTKALSSYAGLHELEVKRDGAWEPAAPPSQSEARDGEGTLGDTMADAARLHPDEMLVTLTRGELGTLIATAVQRALDEREAHPPVDWLTTKQAAELLAVSERTVFKLRHEDALPCHEPAPGMLRYKRSELEAWMSRRKAG